MIITGQVQALRFTKAFVKRTRIVVQVIGPQTITLSTDQGEAQNAADGIILTQATTATPYSEWWKGDLWFRSSIANGPFNLLILGDE